MGEEKRWALITVASSGLGTELARVFAERGYSLLLTARREERLTALAAELRAKHGIAPETLVFDLEDPAATQARFAELPYDQQVAMVELNVSVPLKLSRLFLPGMIERRQGGILNVASTAAFQAGPKMAVYYATKAFVLSLSEALHEEVRRHGLAVTALCPGPVPTEFSERASLQMTRLVKMRFMTLSAEEVARQGVAGYERGKAIVIPGVVNKLGAWGAQIGPRAAARAIAGKLQG